MQRKRDERSERTSRGQLRDSHCPRLVSLALFPVHQQQQQQQQEEHGAAAVACERGMPLVKSIAPVDVSHAELHTTSERTVCLEERETSVASQTTSLNASEKGRKSDGVRWGRKGVGKRRRGE